MGEERRIERLEFELSEAGTDILDLRKQLAEALAEIERLKQEHEKALVNAKNYMVELSAAYLAEDQSITELVAQKDRLIEQMREALKAMLRYPMLPIELDEIAEAALAAERISKWIENRNKAA